MQQVSWTTLVYLLGYVFIVQQPTWAFFWSHLVRHTTVGRTPLDEGSARRRDHYMTTHTTFTRERTLPPAGFEPAVAASYRPQVLVLDRSATGLGFLFAIIFHFHVTVPVQNCIRLQQSIHYWCDRCTAAELVYARVIIGLVRSVAFQGITKSYLASKAPVNYEYSPESLFTATLAPSRSCIPTSCVITELI